MARGKPRPTPKSGAAARRRLLRRRLWQLATVSDPAPASAAPALRHIARRVRRACLCPSALRVPSLCTRRCRELRRRRGTLRRPKRRTTPRRYHLRFLRRHCGLARRHRRRRLCMHSALPSRRACGHRTARYRPPRPRRLPSRRCVSRQKRVRRSRALRRPRPRHRSSLPIPPRTSSPSGLFRFRRPSRLTMCRRPRPTRLRHWTTSLRACQLRRIHAR